MSNGDRQGGAAPLRAAWARLSAWGLLALAAATLALVLLVASAWPLVRDTFARRVGDVAALEAEQERQAGLYAEAMEQRVRQISGRSMFFIPPAPAEVAAQEEEEPQEQGPPPRPTTYAGPDVIAVVNGTVWFGNERRIPVGREEDGIRVVSVAGAPWTVRLEWRGVEFDVEVFERTTSRFLEKEEGGT